MMLYRGLIMVTVVTAAVAFVFHSAVAAVAAAVVGIFAFIARGMDL